MRYFLCQDSKELFSAEFCIYNEASQRVGCFKVADGFEGQTSEQILAKNIYVKGNFYNHNLNLGLKNTIKEGGIPVIFPCFITENGVNVGSVYKNNTYTSLLENAFINNIRYKNDLIDIYGVPLGNEGLKNLIYRGSFQIAEIHKDAVVNNDLHCFIIDAFTEYATMLSVISAIYWYILRFYTSGNKTTNGNKIKIYERTKDKMLLSKYNEHFIELADKKINYETTISKVG